MAAEMDYGRFFENPRGELPPRGRPSWPRPPVNFRDQEAFNRYQVKHNEAVAAVIESLLEERQHTTTRFSVLKAELGVFFFGLAVATGLADAGGLAHLFGFHL